MSCCKKTKPVESGVHLTERTCSPYNPIIKQLVDDCLGLPIYLITSIDAVIDEDGKTLRELLEELLNLVGVDNPEIQKIWIKINQILEDMDNLDYLTENSEVIINLQQGLRTLLQLVQHIARMGDESDLDYYSNGIPYIVKVIRDLRDKVGNDDDPNSLAGKLNALLILVKAIAEYDTEYEYGLTGSNPMLPIIKEIEDLKTQLENWEVPEDLEERLHIIETNIANLSETLGKKANLDDELLEYGVNKLEADEYPVTSMKFLSSDEIPYTKGFYYFPEAYEVHFNERNRCDIYPIRPLGGSHDELWSLSDLNENGVGVNGLKLYAGNGILDLQDITICRNSILKDIFIFGYNIKNLKIFNGTFLVDVNEDGESSVADINEIVNLYVNSNENLRQISIFGRSHALLVTADGRYVWHPLIDGKVYVNTENNSPYRFNNSVTNPKMIPLIDVDVIVEGEGVTLTKAIIENGDNIHKQYLLSFEPQQIDNIELEAGDNININTTIIPESNKTKYTISANDPETVTLKAGTNIEINSLTQEGTTEFEISSKDTITSISGDIVNIVTEESEENSTNKNYKIEGIKAYCKVVNSLSSITPEENLYYIAPIQYEVYNLVRSADDIEASFLSTSQTGYPTIQYSINDVTNIIDFLLGNSGSVTDLQQKKEIFKRGQRAIIEYWFTDLQSLYLTLEAKTNRTEEEERQYLILVAIKDHLEQYVVDDLSANYSLIQTRTYEEFVSPTPMDGPERPVGYEVFNPNTTQNLLTFSPNDFYIYVRTHENLNNVAGFELRYTSSNDTYRVYKYTPSHANLSESTQNDIIQQTLRGDEPAVSISIVTHIIDSLLSQNGVPYSEIRFDYQLVKYTGTEFRTITNTSESNSLYGVIFINTEAKNKLERFWTYTGFQMERILPYYLLKEDNNEITLYEDNECNSIVSVNNENVLNVSFIASQQEVLAVCTDHSVVLIYNNNIVDNPYGITNIADGTTLEFTAYPVVNLGEDAVAKVATYTYTKTSNLPTE